MNKWYNWFYDRKSGYRELNFLCRVTRIAEVTVRRFFSQNLNTMATALTYYTLFAVVPVLALVFGFTRGFRWEKMLKANLLGRFSEHTDAIEWIFQFADRALQNARSGVVTGVGVAVLVVAVLLLANHIEKAFNSVWMLPQRRGMIRKLSDSLSILILTPIVLIIASSGGVMLNRILMETAENLPGASPFIQCLLPLSSKILPFVLSVLVFTVIYLKAPNTKVSKSAAFAGGVLGGVLYQVLQAAFIYAQTWLSKYNAIYGSFAALPLFLIYLNWSWNILLFGAEFSFICQNIPSGGFEIFERKYSKWQNFCCQLLIVRHVIFQFERGGKPPRYDDVADNLNLSNFVVRGLVDELVEADVLAAMLINGGKKIGFRPAKPSKFFTILNIFKSLMIAGKDLADEPVSSDMAWINQNCGKLEEEIKASSYNRCIGDI